MDAIPANFLSSVSQENYQGKDNAVGIYPEGGEKWRLSVTRLDFIEHVIIPLFNSVTFRSKKHKDFLDWVAMFNILKKAFTLFTWRWKVHWTDFKSNEQ